MKRTFTFALSLLCLALCVCLAGYATNSGWYVDSAVQDHAVSVDNTGLVTAHQAGEDTVYYTLGDVTIAFNITVEPFTCPACETAVQTAAELPQHRVLSDYCPDEAHHRACEADARHYCAHCETTYDCILAADHAKCLACTGYWCAGDHKTPPCGNINHRPCMLGDEYLAADHAENPAVPGTYICQDAHDTLPCGIHTSGQIDEEAQTDHYILDCGHLTCEVGVPGEESIHTATCDCEQFLCTVDHDLPCGLCLSCQVPEAEHADHYILDCGHSACAVDDLGFHVETCACGEYFCWVDHDLPCGLCLSCQVPESEHADHYTLDCSHSACAVDELGPHVETCACGEYLCWVDHTLPCGMHLSCQIDEAAHADHYILDCGHSACAVDELAAHTETCDCGEFTCWVNHALPCGTHLSCQIDEAAHADHYILDCGHLTCEVGVPGEESLHTATCDCEQFLCIVDHELPCGMHLSCQIDEVAHADHYILDCGHSACAVDDLAAHTETCDCGEYTCWVDHALPCGTHLSCQIDEVAHADHYILDCRHSACAVDDLTAHTETCDCGEFTCWVDHALPCGTHLSCQIDEAAHADHYILDCGHSACTADTALTHAQCVICTVYLCDPTHGTVDNPCEPPSTDAPPTSPPSTDPPA